MADLDTSMLRRQESEVSSTKGATFSGFGVVAPQRGYVPEEVKEDNADDETPVPLLKRSPLLFLKKKKKGGGDDDSLDALLRRKMKDKKIDLTAFKRKALLAATLTRGMSEADGAGDSADRELAWLREENELLRKLLGIHSKQNVAGLIRKHKLKEGIKRDKRMSPVDHLRQENDILVTLLGEYMDPKMLRRMLRQRRADRAKGKSLASKADFLKALLAAAAKPTKDKKKKKKGKKGRKPRERGGDDDAAGHALTPEELANWRVQDEALFARRLDQEVAIMRRLLRGKLDPAQLDAYIAAYRARAREELMHKFACRRCLGLRGNVRQLEREIARWKASDAALRAELDKGRQHYVRLAKDAATTEHENQALIKQQQQLSDHAETIKRLEEKIEVAADREARMRRLLLIKMGVRGPVLEARMRRVQGLTPRFRGQPFRDLEDILHILVRRLDVSTVNLKGVCDELAREEAAIAALTADRDALQEELRDTRAEMDHLRRSSMETVNTLHANLDRVYKKNKKLSRRVKELNRETNGGGGAGRTPRSGDLSAEASPGRSGSAEATPRRRRQHSRRDLANLEATVAALEAEVSQYAEANADLRDVVAAADAHADAQTSRIAELEAELADSEQAWATVQAQLRDGEVLRSEVRALRLSLDDEREARRVLGDEAEKARNQCRAVERRRDLDVAATHTLRQKLDATLATQVHMLVRLKTLEDDLAVMDRFFGRNRRTFVTEGGAVAPGLGDELDAAQDAYRALKLALRQSVDHLGDELSSARRVLRASGGDSGGDGVLAEEGGGRKQRPPSSPGAADGAQRGDRAAAGGDNALLARVGVDVG